ncbi:MAG: ABC-type transport auxiliary lipoprotein family protein, partial [Verrucomicrobiota bacterium]
MNHLSACAAALFLVGCAQTQPARMYILSTPPAESATSADHLSEARIVVARVWIPKHLDHPQIITRTNDVELHYSEFHRWGQPLADHLTDTISLNL